MIYIFTALYCEAHMLIEQFHLKKVMESADFQQFYNETGQIRLTVSGVGEIAAAAAVSSVCTKYRPKSDDLLLNVGTCAGTANKRGIFLMHKIVEQATGKTFYPDILYRHPFQEAILMTEMVPWNRNNKNKESISGRYFYDMEAAAVYQAGAYFFGPHQMVFLKVVSDNGGGELLSGIFIEQLMQEHKGCLTTFLNQLLQIQQIGRQDRRSMDLHENEWMKTWLDQICGDMHCSKAMHDSVSQYIRYAMLAGTDYKTIVQDMYHENKLPCKDKREGKRCFEELKQRLL